jgi:hypothetical protein
MYELKPIAKDSIPRALSRAERYRLLNEPSQAESICRDVLAVDPGNQEAVVCLILAVTDMFEGMKAKVDEARSLVARLPGEFERRYYAGVIEERWGRALLSSGYPGDVVFHAVRSAMQCFDSADQIAPPGNDDAVLRWNTCVRMLERHHLAPSDEPEGERRVSFDDDVPMR